MFVVPFLQEYINTRTRALIVYYKLGILARVHSIQETANQACFMMCVYAVGLNELGLFQEVLCHKGRD